MARTSEQERAVNSDAHKIIVSASAGSGKTTTMMARIEQILRLGHCRLDQLLVLTFTEASAKDMRKKLQQNLGSQVAPVELQAAAIGTFHGFCANLVRAWFSVAGVSPTFTIIDAIESNKIRNEIVAQLLVDQYATHHELIAMFAGTRRLDGLQNIILAIDDFLATRQDPEQWLATVALRSYQTDLDHNPAIQALITDYQRQAQWFRSRFIDLQYQHPQMDYLLNLITQILAANTYQTMHDLAALAFPDIKKDPSFPAYEEFHQLRNAFRDQVVKKIKAQFAAAPSQVVTDIAADRQLVVQLIDLVQQFDHLYSAKKLALNQLDFADLEKYALQVLNHAEALTSIREQYQYIFVDEGQDTNPVQFQIIDLLRGDDKFFYLVGDVKQSIYGFRGCEPEIFAQMTMQDLMTVLRFNKNFRSNDQILNFVNQVFTPLMANYATDHQFILDQPVALTPENPAVKIELADDMATQMALVYEQIANTTRPWSDIAILSEVTTHFPALQKYLTERGIACVVDRKIDALTAPEIKLLNYFLMAALNPTNMFARYLALKHLFGCTNDDLARIKLGQKAVPEIEAVFTKYHQLARTLSTYEVFSMAATEFGFLTLPVVDAFLNAIRGVASFDTVARYLYLVEHQLVQVEVNVGAQTTNAVRLMTIHNAKGLEFPVVILFNMGDAWSAHGRQQQIVIDKNYGLGLLSVDVAQYVQKSSLLRLGLTKAQQQNLIAEKIRLLYVALTRAKDDLYIVGVWQPATVAVDYQNMLDLIHPLGAVRRTDVPVKPPLVATATTVPTITPVKLKHVTAHDTLVKQSVTALAQAHQTVSDYVAPVQYADNGGKEFGTAFHKQVQYGALPPLVADLVAGYTVYKEFPFLYLQGATIIQGIMDLLAVRGQEAIIVDYKTTRTTPQQLVARYREQLRLYAAALGTQYQIKTYIYSTVHQQLIAVS